MKKWLIALLVLGAISMTGCFGSSENGGTKEITVMTKAEVKNSTTTLFSCDYIYDKQGNRTAATIVERSSSGTISRNMEYNLDHNITKLVKKVEDGEGNVVSNDTYTYEYGYSTGSLIISKNGSKKYEILFFDGDDIKVMKEESYKILENYLRDIENGYAIELNYLKSVQEESWNVKNMIKSVQIYKDNTTTKVYKIEYSARNKISTETTEIKKYSYVYDSSSKIIGNETDIFGANLNQVTYQFQIDKKGNRVEMAVNGLQLWKKLVYYDDSNNILKESFTSDDSYMKKNFSNYEREYVYALGEIYRITTDYSKNTGEGEEKGVYSATANKVIDSYNNGTYTVATEYNANGTPFKYNLSSALPGITCNTVMDIIGDEE